MASNFPSPPIFTDEVFAECQKSGEYSPIFFEWYKYTGILSNRIASIHPHSPAIRPLPLSHHAVLTGLLNRCSRLMLANMSLSSNGLFGETVAIIDRCIFESCVKLRWLCTQRSADAFVKYFKESIKADWALKSTIDEKVRQRGGVVVEIEQRMLSSIERTIRSCGVSDEELRSARPLPDLASMLASLSYDRLFYVVGQKIGSHHVHGNWTNLHTYYLKCDENGLFSPRDHDCPMHINQYVFIPLCVLSGMRDFVEFSMPDASDALPFLDVINGIHDSIIDLYREIAGPDFEPISNR